MKAHHCLPSAATLLVLASSALGQAPASTLRFLQNDTVRVGIDLNLGGAITWISRAESEENIVNSFDYGRQIQMSYFSGPVPFSAQGRQPAAHWKQLGWNPIQSGDHFGNPSGSLQFRESPNELYVRCQPLHWPLPEVRAQCIYECWLHLDGPAIRVRCRLTNQRDDQTQYRARDQEMPAVYTCGPYYRLLTYTGVKPFTGDSLTRIPKRPSKRGSFPWSRFSATENWAALVNEQGFGLGIYQPACQSFLGGFAGREGSGGPKDNATGYIAPNRREILDHNIVHQYDYTLILGTVKQIREYVYENRKPAIQSFEFQKNRQGWFHLHARDHGWPIKGQFHLVQLQQDPQLISPEFFWSRPAGVKIHGAWKTKQRVATLFWNTLGQSGFPQQNRVQFKVIPDGSHQTYDVPLPPDVGPITQLRFDPVDLGHPGDEVKLSKIELLDRPVAPPTR